ncbi:MAG: retron system putative HNH endonuclease [Leptothrix ochracea]|uniref:retron system putative HNH endonuclease n=1 Tax=Leptothrix ochracea TaxID=735331 RepID=UPI0034E25525
MVELQHGSAPQALTDFMQVNPRAAVADFDSLAFRPIKDAVKAALNEDQHGLCAYCERELVSTAGQIDHIKPKGGPNARPDLCYQYRNYAHSCIDNTTCGQKKKHGLLPIEPGPGCNAEWTLSTVTGHVEPVLGLTRQRRHAATQTRDMLGLNTPALSRERKQWLDQVLNLLQEAPDEWADFMRSAPFRHVIGTVV